MNVEPENWRSLVSHRIFGFFDRPDSARGVLPTWALLRQEPDLVTSKQTNKVAKQVCRKLFRGTRLLPSSASVVERLVGSPSVQG